MKTVNVRRPWGYLGVGACLAVVALLLPGTPPPSLVDAVEPEPERTNEPQIACEPVDRPPVGSLRPQGPLPAPGNMPPGSTMARIAERGWLIVAVDQSKDLSGFRDPLSGELKGFDIEVAYQIAEAIFGDTENRVRFVVKNIADRKDVIKSGEVDLVVNHFSITCARQEDVEFSTGYLEALQRILVPIGSDVDSVDDLAGRRVCTSRGSTNQETIEKMLNRPVEQVPNVADCMVLLQQGRVDAITSDDIILAGLANQDRRTEVVGPPFAQAWYGVGMSKSEDAQDLVRFVNGVLEQSFADGTWAARYDHWYGEVLGQAPPPPPAFYRD